MLPIAPDFLSIKYLFSMVNVEEAENNLIKLLHTKVAVRDITLGKFAIHYIVAGKGHPLILIHGANIGWGEWYPNIAALAKKYTVYALDLPGSGGSTRVAYRSFPMAAASVSVVDEFVTKLKLQKTHIIGHSFGGYIALKLALLQKSYIDKVVLVNPMGFTKSIPHKQKAVAFSPLVALLKKTAMRPTRHNMHSFLMSVLHGKPVLPDEFIDYYYRNVISPSLSHPLDFMKSLTENFYIKKEIMLAMDLKKLKRPVLLLLGDKDPMTPVKPVLQHAVSSNITIQIFHNTGHVPSLENPKKFNDIVGAFLG